MQDKWKFSYIGCGRKSEDHQVLHADIYIKKTITSYRWFMTYFTEKYEKKQNKKH